MSHCESNLLPARFSSLILLLSSSGLESDDSCEVSFKDALVFDSKKVTDGSTTQENGVWERR